MKRVKPEADLLPFRGKKSQLPKMEDGRKSGLWPNWKNRKQNNLLHLSPWIEGSEGIIACITNTP